MHSPIDEMVTTLAKWDRPALEGLRQSFPTDGELLQEGIFAGPSPAVEGGTPKKDSPETESRIAEDPTRPARLATARAALQAASASYRTLVVRLGARLRSARSLATWGQGLTVIAGASIMANAATAFPIPVKVLCGILALAASLLGLVAQRRLRPDDSEEASLQSLFKKLTEAGVLAESLALEAGAHEQSPPEAFETFIGQVNSACRRINEVAPYLT